MNNKDVIRKTAIIVLILIIILILVLFIINKNETNNTKTNQYENKQFATESIEQNNKNLEKVKSATAFFTVESCVNKYINYLLQNDAESVYRILDNEYIQKHEITQTNVLNKISDIPEQVIFEATKMYVEEVDENNNKYYVSGILKQDTTAENSGYATVNNNFNITVVLNFKDMIFSIIPFEDGGVLNEE